MGVCSHSPLGGAEGGAPLSGKDAGMTVQLFPKEERAGGTTAFFFSSPLSPQLFFPLIDEVVIGPGLQIQGLEMGHSLARNYIFKLQVRIPRSLMGNGRWTVPSPHLAKLGFTVNADIWLGGARVQ